MKQKKTIGRAVQIDFLDYGITNVIAKVDTGADLNSIWATNIIESKQGLSFTLFGDTSPYHNGLVIAVKPGEYKLKNIENSFGANEPRFVVKLRIKVGGRIVKSAFTLADRSKKTYPILLGRKLLNGKFIVDVSEGTPLVEEEKRKRKLLHIALGEEEG